VSFKPVPSWVQTS